MARKHINWESEELHQKCYDMARKGFLNKDIAASIECGLSTFLRKKRENKTLRDHIKKGYGLSTGVLAPIVESTLIKIIDGYYWNKVEVKRTPLLDKVGAPIRDEKGNPIIIESQKVTKIHEKPNVTGIIYWLNNNYSDLYQAYRSAKAGKGEEEDEELTMTSLIERIKIRQEKTPSNIKTFREK